MSVPVAKAVTWPSIATEKFMGSLIKEAVDVVGDAKIDGAAGKVYCLTIIDKNEGLRAQWQ